MSLIPTYDLLTKMGYILENKKKNCWKVICLHSDRFLKERWRPPASCWRVKIPRQRMHSLSLIWRHKVCSSLNLKERPIWKAITPSSRISLHSSNLEPCKSWILFLEGKSPHSNEHIIISNSKLILGRLKQANVVHSHSFILKKCLGYK